ncbi:hypothetical protein [Rhodanobacter sp. MP7CTX1]|uniref:hypothetical protein n=1 Tax=Rhodanobacter sp. MP7CTX1 TaxID=2723084 RepID=UPI00161089B4|nr:hypothetical protein [Rhodanobacter sp. MP7CTX1]MBB6185749.1 hypothetical protein [Rhodanobacter sp. MP7CTX1]
MTPQDVCSVDWVKVFDSGKDVLVAGAAVLASCVTWHGINSWRREQRGKADFEVARALARALYAYRDAVTEARQGVIRTSEHPPASDSVREASPQQRAEFYAHVFEGRLKPLNAAAVELEAARNEAEALWGAKARTLVNAALECKGELRGAMWAYVANEQPDGEHFDDHGISGFADMVRMTVFDATTGFNGPDIDPFGIRLSERIDAVQQMLQQHLSGGQKKSRR